MVTSKVTSKNQITLPKSVRHRLGIGKGDIVVFAEDSDGRFVVTRQERRVSMADIAGKLEIPGRLLSPDEENAAALEALKKSWK